MADGGARSRWQTMHGMILIESQPVVQVNIVTDIEVKSQKASE